MSGIAANGAESTPRKMSIPGAGSPSTAATTRSPNPSPLRSPTARRYASLAVLGVTVNVGLEGRVPVSGPANTATVPSALATIRSGAPSPETSPIAVAFEAGPVEPTSSRCTRGSGTAARAARGSESSVIARPIAGKRRIVVQG